jgi:transposase
VDAEHRIADLEAQIAAKDARIAEQDARIAEQDARIAEQDARIAEQDARIAEQDARIAELEKKLAALVDERGRNSSNSNLPPSSDSPAVRAEKNARKRAAKQEKRKRGAQPGHRGHRRALVPPEHVDDFVDLFPKHCEHCATALPETEGPKPVRFQVIELPAFEPHTTEYRRHCVTCPRCRGETTAPHDPARIPASPFGPRLMSAIGLLTGVYHVSRRKTAQLLSDLMGVKLSLGAVSAVEARVSEAVKAPAQEALQRVLSDTVKHTDGTTWYQSGVALTLWVLASSVATVFKVLANGQMETVKALFGRRRGVLVSDRATALKFWDMERRQICWAHLMRKFIKHAERDGPGGRFGRELLDFTGLIFDYWHRYREKSITRGALAQLMAPVRAQFEATLERAAASGGDHVAGSCADILEHRAALWTFVDQAHVEPTNNHAERELRAFVLWRKTCYGAQSERGNRFAERVMTVAHTARKQNKNVLEFLTECCVAHVDGGEPPSLFARAA